MKAGIGVIAGKTVWSMPERLECEVLQKERCVNTLTFTFTFTFTFTWSRLKPSLGVFLWNAPSDESRSQRSRVPVLPESENRMIIWSLVLTYYSVWRTDGRTDTPPMANWRSSNVAERDKKLTEKRRNGMNCLLFICAVDGDWKSVRVHIRTCFGGLPPVETLT